MTYTKAILDDIPEEDKCCINCKHWLRSELGEDDLCEGIRPCLNWRGEHEANYFEPADDYIKDYYANCENCYYEWDYEVCSGCTRCPDLQDRWKYGGERNE